MKISLYQLLLIRQRDFNILNRAFAEALGEHYGDADYTLTVDDAKLVGERIEAQMAEAEKLDIFGVAPTPDEVFARQREINVAADAFRSLLADFGLI